MEAHDLMPSNQWLDVEETDLFLRTICDNEFRQYDLVYSPDIQHSSIYTRIEELFGRTLMLLTYIYIYILSSFSLREIDGERYIGDALPGTELVPSSADGHWDTK